jgi:hypothetical protein
LSEAEGRPRETEMVYWKLALPRLGLKFLEPARIRYSWAFYK